MIINPISALLTSKASKCKEDYKDRLTFLQYS